MTKKDESPEEGANPYWSDELLAVLAEALGDEDRARQTLEGIIQQAQEGKAMQTLSTERLASYLTELYGRIAEGVQNSGVKKRRSLDTKSGVVAQAATAAIDKAHSELLEELLEERVAMAEELAERKRELTKAKDKSDATVRVASALERAKEAAEAESRSWTRCAPMRAMWHLAGLIWAPGGAVVRPPISATRTALQALGQPPPEKPIYALSIAW